MINRGLSNSGETRAIHFVTCAIVLVGGKQTHLHMSVHIKGSGNIKGIKGARKKGLILDNNRAFRPSVSVLCGFTGSIVFFYTF